MVEKFEFLHSFDDNQPQGGIGSVLSQALHDEIFQDGFKQGAKEAREESQGDITQHSFDQGVKSAMDNIQANMMHSCEQLNDNLRTLINRQDKIVNDIGQEVKELLMVCLEKFIPYYCQAGAVTEISKLIEKVIKLRGDDNKITITISEQTKQELLEKLKQLLTQQQFESIVVKEMASGEPSDCKINWLDGGIERCREDLMTKIEKIIETLMTQGTGNLKIIEQAFEKEQEQAQAQQTIKADVAQKEENVNQEPESKEPESKEPESKEPESKESESKESVAIEGDDSNNNDKGEK